MLPILRSHIGNVGLVAGFSHPTRVPPTAIALRSALQSPDTDGRGRPPADYFGLSIWSAQ